MTKYIVQDMQLTSIANAIREKGGLSSSLLFPDDFIDAIENISGNTPEPTPLVEKDVNFYDYDGTLVYSYTSTDFLALSAMPENPDHSNDEIPLTSQGWNYSLSDAQSYVTAYDQLNIGAMYIPTDGKTHIIIYINEDVPAAQRKFILFFTQSIDDAVTVDWGDNIIEQYSESDGDTKHMHTYSNSGVYHITLNVLNGEYINLGGSGSNSYNICGNGTNISPSSSAAHFYMNPYVKTVIFGNGVSFNQLTCDGFINLENIIIAPNITTSLNTAFFRNCRELNTVILPSSITTLGNYCFDKCDNLKNIILPNSLTTIGSYFCNYCSTLKTIFFPLYLETLGDHAFYYCTNLISVILPDSLSAIPTYCFAQCYRLPTVKLPNSITTLPEMCFYSCKQLISITIPETASTLENYSLAACEQLKEIHLKRRTAPTISTYTFQTLPYECIIYVPVVNNYTYATGWSSYAQQIQQEPS